VSLAYFGFVTGPVAIAGGYPYAIGPLGTLLCQTVRRMVHCHRGGIL
jgi:hypothetical protein